jgi:hypothetical protein
MEDRHLKLLFRHVLTSFLASCPRQVRPPWLLPILNKLLPHMQQRLVTKWAQVSGSGGAAAANGGQQQQQQQQQLSEEVVAETILREMTREYMVVLSKATERALPPGSSLAGGGAAASGAAAAAAAAAALAGPPAGPEQESVVETLWQHDQGAMRALMGVAVAGMCWPDSQAAGKATRICM